MGIALTLRQYLDDQCVDYDVMTHEPTSTTSQTAQAAHIPGRQVAKGVVISREGGFLIAVVPSSCHVDLEALERLVDGPVAISKEDEISVLFPDCDTGAIPPLAKAYGLQAIVDKSIDERSDVYMEAGDHCCLIHLSGKQFQDLLADEPRANIAERF